jgi:hypothetical protein
MVVVRPSPDEDVTPCSQSICITSYLPHVRKGVDPSEMPLHNPPQKEDLKRRRKNLGKHRLPHLVAEPNQWAPERLVLTLIRHSRQATS